MRRGVDGAVGAESVSLDTILRREFKGAHRGRHRGLLLQEPPGKRLPSLSQCVPYVVGHISPVALDVCRAAHPECCLGVRAVI